MPTIITILSEQPIPNVLFLKEFAGPNDNHVFISSTEMQKSRVGNSILAACGIPESNRATIVVNANSVVDIYQRLSQHPWQDGEKYTVNLTGGNKLMSQVVFSFFRDRDSEMYYLPIKSTTLQQLHPTIEEREISRGTKIDLKSYFLAHGYEIQKKNVLSKHGYDHDLLFDQVLAKNGAGGVKLLKNAGDETYFGADKGYLMGGWFEEWIYEKIKLGFGLSDEEIGFSIKCKSIHSESTTESDTEIDVAFIYQNKLVLVECKVFKDRTVDAKKIFPVMDKLAVRGATLGKEAKKIATILSNFGPSPEKQKRINDYKRENGVEVFSLEDFKKDRNLVLDFCK